ncbi:MAG: hypothetical protein JXA39_06100 [Bacteroidales bacterium]|nr:hypothetical protein [Bacteroidales bacterium]
MRHRLIILFFLFSILIISCRKSTYTLEYLETITDQGGGTGTQTWKKDKTYLLSGFVFVNDGQVLTIEAGTLVQARTGQGSLASALIVARGGKIIAEGNPENPIIFTVEGDDLKGSIPIEAKGLWGGLIILGHATINTESGEDLIEGIPVSEPRGVYGGLDDDDNSGILRYVSIRHGGTNIGEGNEINGLTLGGIGRQTIIDHVEVISNADDGVEIFGGTVNCRNVTVSLCGDDAFDFDQGYCGKLQFLMVINGPDSDLCLEYSGGLQPVPNLPGSQPILHNMTFFGDSLNSSIPVIHFSDYGGGHIMNSIFLFPGRGMALEYSAEPGDSYALYNTNRLTVKSNIFFPKSNDIPSLFYCYSNEGTDLSRENQDMDDSFLAWLNSCEDPGFTSHSGIQILPPVTQFENMAAFENEWFEEVTYKGAFGSKNWIEGWTLIYESGMIVN